ncbi:F-box stress induced 2 [Hibiscus trionum]|uniref:F-box stress induced 2 n=1 Tax=Hibiscus trionum TaxID=183268 RepID=A0A9W7JEI5_HIBTR|nr:F-box stress induced 2 [Hibiscus trionum]
MSLGRVYRSTSLNLKHEVSDGEESQFGFVRCMFGLGRKRVGISYETEDLTTPLDFATNVPLLKRQCNQRMVVMPRADDYHEKSTLESLPQDVLIRIICGVDHKDLKQLFNVSKSFREAIVITKQSHFAYSTPTKIKTFRTSINFEESNELDDIEAPNAPRQWRSHRKKLVAISVELFA